MDTLTAAETLIAQDARLLKHAIELINKKIDEAIKTASIPRAELGTLTNIREDILNLALEYFVSKNYIVEKGVEIVPSYRLTWNVDKPDDLAHAKSVLLEAQKAYSSSFTEEVTKILDLVKANKEKGALLFVKRIDRRIQRYLTSIGFKFAVGRSEDRGLITDILGTYIIWEPSNPIDFHINN